MSIAYSFAKEGRGNSGSGRHDSPSPDAYDPLPGMRVVKEASPEWTISRTERPGVQPGGPGPGEYDADINKLKMNVSYSMGGNGSRTGYVGSPQKNNYLLVPGPGSYEPTLQNKMPTYTMGQKRKEISNLNTPGPGAYDGNDSMTKSQRNQGSPFGSKSRRETSLVNQANMSDVFYSPGPGAYSPKHDQVKYKNPVYGIYGQKGITSRDLSPGPGAYEANAKEMGKGLNNISFKGRPKTAKPNDIPGPGQYDTNHHRTITATTKSQRGISSMNNKSERLLSISRDQMSLPGPGAYDANVNAVKDKVRNIGFGKTSRDGIVGKEEKLKPGPGNYNVKDTKSTKSFKIGQKINTSFKNQAPGPGKYEPNHNVVKDSIRNVKISNALSKSVLTSSKSQYIPGPGTYASTNEFGKNAQSFSIRGKPKDNQRNDSPGPGAYDPNDCLSKERIKAANMNTSTRRQDFSNTSNNLGPGQYSENHKTFGKDSKSFTFTSKPQDKQDTKVPGPGAYDAKDNLTRPFTPGYKQSTSKRQDLVSPDQKSKPGPGQYTSNHKAFGSDAVTYSMGTKREYKQELSPGPGQYDASQQLTKDSVRNFKMNTSKRPDVAPKTAREMPGPGAYDSIKKFGQDKPAFSIMSKRSEVQRDKTPGPGTYDAAANQVRDKSPSYRMGTGQRTQVINKEVVSKPGPGNYDQKSTLGQNGPKYTFSTRKESKQTDQTPGPGVYEPNKNFVKDKVVSYQMGASQRTQIVSKEVTSIPGPGNYDSPAKSSGPKYSMMGRSKSRQELSPGPGQYDPKDFLSKDKTPSYAINKSLRQEIVHKSISELPGPGTYLDPNEFGKNVKSFSIRGKADDKVRNEVPGPGSYQADPHAVKDRVISHKMSKSQRADIVTKEMLYQPGPGEYDSPKAFGHDAVSVTIRGRPEDNYRNDSPGPGQYNPAHGIVKDRIVTYKMASNSKRTDIVSKEVQQLPGPGIYDQQSTIGKNQSYTIGTKAKQTQDNKVPGPGFYDPKEYLTKDQAQTSFRIAQSNRQQMVSREVMEKPGPGQYDSPSKWTGPTYTMGGRSESPIDRNVPGPGQYDPNEGLTKYASPAFKINDKSQRTQLVSREEIQKPGPGNYQTSKNFGDDVKSFSIRGKPQDKVGNDVPGPGNYDPSQAQNKDRVISYKIGSSQRTNIVNKERTMSPGPGQYDSPTRQTGPNYTMGGRTESPVEYKPGPGQYDPNESITKYASPAFKINDKSQRTQLVSKEDKQKPGPGNYTDRKTFGEDAKSFSIRGRPQDRVGNEVPGPGNYEPIESQNKDRVITYKIGTSQRQTIVNKESSLSPGPGHYDSPSKHTGPNYTMGGRPESPVDNTKPGPGQYDPNESITKYTSPAYKMNDKTQRSNIVNKEVLQKPGPGNYAVNKAFGEDAKSFSIRGRPQDKVDNTVPGPGNYEPNDSIAKYQSPAYKMNDKTQRSNLVSGEKLSMPGPGVYDQHSTIGQGRAPLIRGKPSPERVSDVPGPGTYEGNANVIKDSTGQSFRMPQKKRDFLSVTQDIAMQPGPGQYDLKSSPSGPVYTIRGRDQVNDDNGVPGPGSYNDNPNVMRHNNPSIDFGRSPDRSRSGSPQREHLPGPGEYDNRDYNPNGGSVIVYSIPKGEKYEPANDTPGPGHYKIPVKFADVPRYSLTAQNEDFRWV